MNQRLAPVPVGLTPMQREAYAYIHRRISAGSLRATTRSGSIWDRRRRAASSGSSSALEARGYVVLRPNLSRSLALAPNAPLPIVLRDGDGRRGGARLRPAGHVLQPLVGDLMLIAAARTATSPTSSPTRSASTSRGAAMKLNAPSGRSSPVSAGTIHAIRRALKLDETSYRGCSRAMGQDRHPTSARGGRRLIRHLRAFKAPRRTGARGTVRRQAPGAVDLRLEPRRHHEQHDAALHAWMMIASVVTHHPLPARSGTGSSGDRGAEGVAGAHGRLSEWPSGRPPPDRRHAGRAPRRNGAGRWRSTRRPTSRATDDACAKFAGHDHPRPPRRVRVTLRPGAAAGRPLQRVQRPRPRDPRPPPNGRGR